MLNKKIKINAPVDTFSIYKKLKAKTTSIDLLSITSDFIKLHSEEFKNLIRNPNIRDRDGRTVLHHAAYNTNVKIIKILALLKADPNIYDKGLMLPIYYLAKYTKNAEYVLQACDMLILMGTNINILNKNEKFVLDEMIGQNNNPENIEITQRLSVKISAYYKIFEKYQTLLASQNDKVALAYLKNNKFLLKFRSEYGYNLISIVTMANCAKNLEYLLHNAKLNPHSVNDNGETPLMIAARLGLSSMVEILVKAGADINQKTMKRVNDVQKNRVKNNRVIIGYSLTKPANALEFLASTFVVGNYEKQHVKQYREIINYLLAKGSSYDKCIELLPKFPNNDQHAMLIKHVFSTINMLFKHSKNTFYDYLKNKKINHDIIDGNSTLIINTTFKKIPIIIRLPLHISNKCGDTLAHLVVKHEKLNRLNNLLKNGLNLQDSEKYNNLLKTAFANKKIMMAEKLISINAPEQGCEKYQPYIAIFKENLDVVLRYIKNRAYNSSDNLLLEILGHVKNRDTENIKNICMEIEKTILEQRNEIESLMSEKIFKITPNRVVKKAKKRKKKRSRKINDKSNNSHKITHEQKPMPFWRPKEINLKSIQYEFSKILSTGDLSEITRELNNLKKKFGEKTLIKSFTTRFNRNENILDKTIKLAIQKNNIKLLGKLKLFVNLEADTYSISLAKDKSKIMNSLMLFGYVPNSAILSDDNIHRFIKKVENNPQYADILMLFDEIYTKSDNLLKDYLYQKINLSCHQQNPTNNNNFAL